MGAFFWCNMDVIRSKIFKADKAWGAKDIANMGGVTTRLHWTINSTFGILMMVKKSLPF
jgi:hypothetical protein